MKYATNHPPEKVTTEPPRNDVISRELLDQMISQAAARSYSLGRRDEAKDKKFEHAQRATNFFAGLVLGFLSGIGLAVGIL